MIDATHKPLTLLITGFGGFPGAPQNPTRLLIKRLERHRSRLTRQGIRLELALLPVSYEDLPKKLTALHESLKPDAVVHFGLASRRRHVSLETRAKNRVSILRVDACGRNAGAFFAAPGGPAQLRARLPVMHLRAELLRARIRAQRSNDAGDYICNQALYLSLTSQAPFAAFIHVPKLSWLTLDELERTALIAIGVCRKAQVNQMV